MRHIKIRPCPFCGGAACLNGNWSNKNRTWFVFVRCDICNGQGKTYRSNEEPTDVDWNNQACEDAVLAWNMRNGPSREAIDYDD